jgi:hypothetical protein
VRRPGVLLHITGAFSTDVRRVAVSTLWHCFKRAEHDSHPTYRDAIACWSPRHGFMATMIKIFSSGMSRIVIFHMTALQSVQNLACDQMLSAAMSTGKRASRRCIFGLSVTPT